MDTEDSITLNCNSCDPLEHLLLSYNGLQIDFNLTGVQKLI